MDTSKFEDKKAEPPRGAEDPKVVETLEVEDDLDTGMHNVNVCKYPY